MKFNMYMYIKRITCDSNVAVMLAMFYINACVAAFSPTFSTGLHVHLQVTLIDAADVSSMEYTV